MAMSSVHVPDLKPILNQLKCGSRREYDIFINRLLNPDTPSPELLAYILAAKECITLLDKEHEILVGVFLKIDWTSREKYVTEGYQSFLLNLVSAHTYYLRAGLRMLIKKFLIQKDEDFDENEDVASKFNNVHLMLKAITKIVPMTPTVLMPLLYEFFPYLTKEACQQECYVRNLLRITQYLPAMRQQIMELIVSKMIKLDVRSPKNDIKEAEGEEEEDMDDEDFMFEMDEPEKGQASISADSGHDSQFLVPAKPMTHKEADKLDIMMYVTLEYIHNSCYKHDKLDWEATKLFYRELLLVFERVILPTHGCCHVQFILFYICSFKQELSEGFLDYLWKRIQDPNAENVFRQSAAAYIGSLLSRALYVPVSTVRTCVDLMCNWLHKYLDQIGAVTLHTDVVHHGAFYAVCQTVFYVFAFRNREIFESPKGHKWAQSLNFQRIVTSRLNPLRICLPVIVKTFASIARMHQLAFCDTIIERNTRCSLPTAGEDSSQTLDSFFPFDPYILHRSGGFMKPLYRDFQGNIIEDKGNNSEDEEDDFINEDIASPSHHTMSLGKTPTDLLNYGTSPGFKHVDFNLISK